MSIELRYLDGGAGVLWIGAGTVRGEDIIACNLEVNSPERLKPMRYQLVDFIGVERLEVTQDQMRAIAAQDRAAAAINPNIVVTIAVCDDLAFGMARMYEGYVGEAFETHVFRTSTEAEDWLRERLDAKLISVDADATDV